MLPRLGLRAPALECGYLAVPPLSVRFSPHECGNVPCVGAGVVDAAGDSAAGAAGDSAAAAAATAGDSTAGAVAAVGVR